VPEQIDANIEVSITLPFGAWQTALGLIGKGPWEVVDPIMQEMRRQILQTIHPLNKAEYPEVKE